MKMIKRSVLAMLFLTAGCMAKTTEEVPVKKFYDIEVKTIAGEPVKLEQYKGKVLLIVNTASKCGFTGQYDGLQKLYETYQDKGFVILGFPSNDFMGQEPGTDEEIKSFFKPFDSDLLKARPIKKINPRLNYENEPGINVYYHYQELSGLLAKHPEYFEQSIDLRRESPTLF